jgi:metal-responsive CopG/Arc/MetJ family transcriptional regulator
MNDDLVKALRAIARIQSDLIAEARRQRQQEERIVGVLRGICEHLEIKLPAATSEVESEFLPAAAREIEMLEKLLKLDPPETNLS